MRALVTRIVFVLTGSLALAGCLVSETPILNATNGDAKPLLPGSYTICEINKEGGENNCGPHRIIYDDTGLYHFTADEDRIVELRFRRVGQRGYTAQVKDGEDTYLYYYAYGTQSEFFLKMMICDHLPERLRDKLSKRGDFIVESDEISVCNVQTLRGLKAAAKSYHRGEASGDEEAVLIIKPASEVDQ